MATTTNPLTGQQIIDGAGSVLAKGYKQSSYSAAVTADGTGVAVVLATGIKEGAGAVELTNLGTTAANFGLAAWGVSEADAIANLNISSGAATTGIPIPPSSAGAGAAARPPEPVPANATHIAIATGVSGQSFSVLVNQRAP